MTLEEMIPQVLRSLPKFDEFPASTVGYLAYPDSEFRTSQGAALAAGRLIHRMRERGLIRAGRWFWQLTAKGRRAAR